LISIQYRGKWSDCIWECSSSSALYYHFWGQRSWRTWTRRIIQTHSFLENSVLSLKREKKLQMRQTQKTTDNRKRERERNKIVCCDVQNVFCIIYNLSFFDWIDVKSNYWLIHSLNFFWRHSRARRVNISFTLLPVFADVSINFKFLLSAHFYTKYQIKSIKQTLILLIIITIITITITKNLRKKENDKSWSKLVECTSPSVLGTTRSDSKS
jgi:hypothetical protein